MAEETNSGVRENGSWKEVAEFSGRVEEAMRETRIDDESIDKFSKWRPRTEEAENDMKEKTVEEATAVEKEVEQKSDGVEDLKNASENAARAVEKTVNRENPESEIKEVSKGVFMPFLSSAVKVIRNFEREVYSRLMLKFNPFYLDTRDFNVDLRSRKTGYRMDISVPDRDSRERIQEELREDE